ncbi:MAG: hypothetical protein BWY13_00906 [Euryarchaeota archaeon ADurb.Bin190]|nr:MAG: hypothetical protein BWY13_00906 [Euryarchaeota archaeon ADurb.Bin190]
MRIKYLSLGLIFSLFLILAVTAETDKEWQEANGGWIVVKNSHQYNTNTFQPCPGQEGCSGYPLHVEHGVCINVVAFADPDVGSKWTPPKDNIILAFDCGYPSGWNTANCPVVTEFWVPAGTYSLTEFTFVSEVNPGDPDYSPCTNAWSKPTTNAVIRPGDRIDFGESIFIGSGTCTAGGYPCPGTGGLSSGRSNIGGTWYMGGPYNEGMACQIIQEGDSLTFINENGQQSSGRFIDSSTIEATDWENGLQGVLSSDGNRIDWANGSWWVRNEPE